MHQERGVGAGDKVAQGDTLPSWSRLLLGTVHRGSPSQGRSRLESGGGGGGGPSCVVRMVAAEAWGG